MTTTPTILDCARNRAFGQTSTGRTSVLPFPCRSTLGPFGRLLARLRIARDSLPLDVRVALALVMLHVAGMATASTL